MTQKEIQNIGTMKQLAMYLNALGLNDLEREEEIQEVINAVCEDKGWMPLSFDPLTKYDMAVLKYEGDDEDVYATNAMLYYGMTTVPTVGVQSPTRAMSSRSEIMSTE